MTEKETKQRILEAASKMFVEKGFAKTSMTDIVKASGVSKGGIYWHFNSKDSIIGAIFEQVFQEQKAFIELVSQYEDTAIKRLRHLGKLIKDSYAEVHQANSPSALDLYTLASRQPHLMQQITSYFTEYQGLLARLIEDGMHSGEFNEVNAEQAAFILMSTIEGMFMLRPMIDDKAPHINAIQEAIELFIAGLQKKDSL